jgi:LPS sulfotransferase NodH
MNGFFIWFEQRSGSSFLVSLLNSHPEIDCRGEMFGASKVDAQNDCRNIHRVDLREFRAAHYRRFLNLFPGQIENPSNSQSVAALNSWFDDSSQIRGFKLKHPSQSGLYPEIMKRLLELKHSIKVIALHRQNYLRRAISLMNMQRIQLVHAKANLKNEIVLPPLNVDIEQVVKLIQYYEASNVEFVATIRQFPNRMDVEYSELAADGNSIKTQLQSFLGVRQQQTLVATTRKITPHHLADAIDNFDELRDSLKSNGLDKYLDG